MESRLSNWIKGSPFHEIIIKMIYVGNDYDIVKRLIIETKISKGHDEIINALETRFYRSDDYKSKDVEYLKGILLDKKKLAEQEIRTVNKKESALMTVIEKMIARFQNHAGDPDQEIFKLFEKAKKIKSAENDEEL